MDEQTHWIAVALFVGFLVFITIRGQLAQYQAAIFGGQSAAPTPTAIPSNPSESQSIGTAGGYSLN